MWTTQLTHDIMVIVKEPVPMQSEGDTSYPVRGYPVRSRGRYPIPSQREVPQIPIPSQREIPHTQSEGDNPLIPLGVLRRKYWEFFPTERGKVLDSVMLQIMSCTRKVFCQGWTDSSYMETKNQFLLRGWVSHMFSGSVQILGTSKPPQTHLSICMKFFV